MNLSIDMWWDDHQHFEVRGQEVRFSVEIDIYSLTGLSIRGVSLDVHP